MRMDRQAVCKCNLCLLESDLRLMMATLKPDPENSDNCIGVAYQTYLIRCLLRLRLLDGHRSAASAATPAVCPGRGR